MKAKIEGLGLCGEDSKNGQERFEHTGLGKSAAFLVGSFNWEAKN